MAENKETAVEKEAPSTINKVINFEPDNHDTLEAMSDFFGLDKHKLVNMAVLHLANLEEEDLIELAELAHQQLIARIKAKFN